MVHSKKAEVSKFIGSLIGSAIGDSLGAEREGATGFEEVHEIGPRYTDDTAMMIGVAESLVACKGFDGNHMAERFIRNFEREPWRGYGWGPPRIFTMIRSGRRWDEMLDRELYPGGSYGNGAAMRVAPVGLYCHDDPEKLREVAYALGKITHSNELALEGAALQGYAIALAVRAGPSGIKKDDVLKELMELARGKMYQDKLKTMGKLLDRDVKKAEVVKELGNGIEAINSVPTAIYSFLCNEDFEHAVVYAVSLGGDADTIAAMSGAVAGACYGIEGIPRKWRKGLENREYIEKLARELGNAKKEYE